MGRCYRVCDRLTVAAGDKFRVSGDSEAFERALQSVVLRNDRGERPNQRWNARRNALGSS
jgi:hypothetical protein